jgi:hypothetical protein
MSTWRDGNVWWQQDRNFKTTKSWHDEDKWLKIICELSACNNLNTVVVYKLKQCPMESKIPSTTSKNSSVVSQNSGATQVSIYLPYRPRYSNISTFFLHFPILPPHFTSKIWGKMVEFSDAVFLRLVSGWMEHVLLQTGFSSVEQSDHSSRLGHTDTYTHPGRQQ